MSKQSILYHPVTFFIQWGKDEMKKVHGFQVGSTSIAYVRLHFNITGNYVYRWFVFDMKTGKRIYSGNFRTSREVKNWIVHNLL
jgi:hypothetical protein